MTTQMLHLSRKSRDVYTAKLHYQHLRMQELDMMKNIMQDELEEIQVYLNRAEHQIGQIRQELHGGRTAGGQPTTQVGEFERLL
ncbi:hypothetical protein EV363DRAFT_1179499 [Boletus edulis]|uniref:Uncharacterized protein n=1 Tax=Boletus edulis BED1 TaxID=1328754 RepID=A0AAD4C9L4_BOLED|nr:hypothetical protein EV363DRAFT_1179499 [Boletus edulis]KAF8452852.1 hypothetical protein L210DRAFT_954921 [Boletus edulis BED1]